MSEEQAQAGEQVPLAVKHKIVHAFHSHPEVKFAILYGSAAERGPFHDLDIGVYVDRETVPESSELDYAFSLNEKLKRIVPYPVDVRVINDAPLPFRYQVSRGSLVVAHDRSAYFDFLERTWRLFLDFRPLAMRYLEEQR
jgi:hypothetical protein